MGNMDLDGILLFFPNYGNGKSYAQLEPHEKNNYSPRGMALGKLSKFLTRKLSRQTGNKKPSKNSSKKTSKRTSKTKKTKY